MRRLHFLRMVAAAVFAAAIGGCSDDFKGSVLAPIMFSEVTSDSTGLYIEPNDTPSQALMIRTDGVVVRQTLHVSSDVDFFRFLAAEKAEYLITVALETGGAVDIAVTDMDGITQPDIVVGSVGEGVTVRSWTPTEAGYFFVRVSAAPGAKNTVGTYSLSIGVGADIYEPDNSLLHAHEIVPNGAWQQRTLPNLLDTDYIAFSAWGGFKYQFVCEGSAADATNFNIVDGSGTVLSTRISTTAVSYAPAADATCYVVIAPVSARAFGTYRVAGVSIDPSEPDSTLALAKAIPTTGEAKRHSFSSEADQDFVQFAGVAGTRYTIRTDSLAAGVDTQIELNSASGTALVSDDNGGGGLASRVSWVAPSTATFFVRVRSGSAGLPGQYVISVAAE